MQIDNKSLVVILLALLVGGAALSAWNAFKTTTSPEPPAVSGEQHVEPADCHEPDGRQSATAEVAEQNQDTAGAGGRRCITQPKPEALSDGFRPGVSGVP